LKNVLARKGFVSNLAIMNARKLFLLLALSHLSFTESPGAPFPAFPAEIEAKVERKLQMAAKTTPPTKFVPFAFMHFVHPPAPPPWRPINLAYPGTEVIPDFADRSVKYIEHIISLSKAKGDIDAYVFISDETNGVKLACWQSGGEEQEFHVKYASKADLATLKLADFKPD
jgi:hypothetical protein